MPAGQTDRQEVSPPRLQAGSPEGPAPALSSWMQAVAVAGQTLLPTSPGAAGRRRRVVERSLPTAGSVPRCPGPPSLGLSFHPWSLHLGERSGVPQAKISVSVPQPGPVPDRHFGNTSERPPCPGQGVGPQGETGIDFFAWKQQNTCVMLDLHCK